MLIAQRAKCDTYLSHNAFNVFFQILFCILSCWPHYIIFHSIYFHLRMNLSRVGVHAEISRLLYFKLMFRVGVKKCHIRQKFSIQYLKNSGCENLEYSLSDKYIAINTTIDNKMESSLSEILRERKDKRFEKLGGRRYQSMLDFVKREVIYFLLIFNIKISC